MVTNINLKPSFEETLREIKQIEDLIFSKLDYLVDTLKIYSEEYKREMFGSEENYQKLRKKYKARPKIQ